MPVILPLWLWRQEDEKFKATLSDKLVKASMRYMRSSCLPETRGPKKKKPQKEWVTLYTEIINKPLIS